MLDYLKSLFWPDEERRNETEKGEQLRRLEMDKPMAGAGALLAGERNKSETERSLERESDHRD
jgi:hypothetical protein